MAGDLPAIFWTGMMPKKGQAVGDAEQGQDAENPDDGFHLSVSLSP